MDFMNQIEDKLLDELKEISQKWTSGEEMTSQCLDDVKDISIALSKLATYQAMKESGYSHESGMSAGRYSRESRGRDGMGRYSRGGYPRNGYGRMAESDWERDYIY